MNYVAFKKACKGKGTTPTALSLKLGLKKGNATSWKNGGNPSVEILIKLAVELDCSTDYLLGLDDVPNRRGVKTTKENYDFKKINYFECSSYNELLSEMQPGGKLAEVQSQYVFRGQSTEYELIPQLMRASNNNEMKKTLHFYAKDSLPEENDIEKLKNDEIDNIEYVYRRAEYNILKDFYNSMNKAGLRIPHSVFESHNNFDLESYLHNSEWLPPDLIDIAALARHYEVPTRLLDWSFDINVALYFAAIGAIRKIVKNENEINKNIVIWLLNQDKIKNYKSEDVFPLRIVVPKYHNNPNLCLQKGALTYWWDKKDSSKDYSKNIAPLNALLNNYYTELRKNALFTISIPRTECLKIIKHLYNNGYNASTLVAGYVGAARKIEEDLLISQAEEIFEKHNKKAATADRGGKGKEY